MQHTLRRGLPALLALLAAAFLALPTLRAEDTPPSAPAKTEADAKNADAAARKRMRALVAYEPTPFEVEANPPVGGDLLVQPIRYPSPYESTHPDPNDTVHGRYFSVPEPSKAGLIVLGGWRRDPITPALGFELAKSGLQVLYLSIPFQERRTPEGRWPGELTLSADLDQTEATFVQLARDVDRGVRWLIEEKGVDADRIGILGTSLGGYATATLFGMTDRFRCATVQLAGADIAGVLFNGNFLTRKIAAQLEQDGVTEDEARARLRGLSPDLWADPARKDDLLLIAAERDTIVPLATVERLAELYGGAELVVLDDQPHIAPVALQGNLPKVRDFLVGKLLTDAERKRLTGGTEEEPAESAESPETE